MDCDSDTTNSQPRISNSAISNLAAANTTLRAKTFREQQAVLSLQALAQQDEVSEKLLGNPIAELTDKLILGAGEDVVDLAERQEREQLEVFQKLITKRLSILQGGEDGNADDHKKSESNGGSTIVVNGTWSGNESTSRRGTPSRSGSARVSKSKSRDGGRGVSRGRN